MLPSPPFAILDFPGFAPRLFASPREIFIAEKVERVRPVLDRVEAASRAGLQAVGFVGYEAAPAFDSALTAHGPSPLHYAWFGAFDESVRLDESLLPRPQRAVEWTPDVTRKEYDAAIAELREAIGRGDYYQVNHTLRLRARGIDPLALWQRLRRAQRGAYAAYIDTGRHVIASASPELFFERDGSRITMRPMKGTATRGRWLAEDDERAEALARSTKDRAENLMIVDLVRNDLGRIAEVGTVSVPRLFDVERWPTVLQMTSTASARLRPGTTTFDIFRALFPCGSVTGAPKVAATRAIGSLERAARGVYCGAIGHFAADQRATFSVAIRTASFDREDGVAEYGVGGGITWDSQADAEYDETVAKAGVLTADVSELELVETLRLEGGRYVRLERHLARFTRSARYFGFRDWEGLRDKAARALRGAARPGVWRARLLVSRDGSTNIALGQLPAPSHAPIVVALAKRPVQSSDPFLFHKTTHREVYERQRGMVSDAFDVLLWNERGELTEFTIGNVVLEIEGEKWTPPLRAGLLGGVFREELLEREGIRERRLYKEDLGLASRVWLINSLREWVAVTVSPSHATSPQVKATVGGSA